MEITTVISTLLNVIKNGADTMEIKIDPVQALSAMGSNRPYKSLYNRAAKTICYYPMIASNAVKPEVADILAKSVERKAIGAIQIILNNEDLIDIDNEMNKQAIINKFKGIALNSGDIGDGTESKDFVRGQNTDVFEFPSVFKKEDLDVIQFLIEHGAEIVADEFTPIDSGLNSTLLQEAKDNNPDKLGPNALAVIKSVVGRKAPTIANYYKMGGKDITLKNAMFADTELLKQKKTNSEMNNTARPSGLKTEKIERKESNLQPTIMPVQVYYTSKGRLVQTEIIVAVKVNTYVIPSSEMVHQIGISLRDNRFVFRTIQWLSGEISFWKDFVLNLDRIKADISNNQKSGTLFWQLRHNAHTAMGSMALGKDHLLPTTTLVLTFDEYEEIRRIYKIDVLSRATASQLIKLFHLAGLIILDEATGSMHNFDTESQRFDRTTINFEEHENHSMKTKDMMKFFSAAHATGGVR